MWLWSQIFIYVANKKSYPKSISIQSKFTFGFGLISSVIIGFELHKK
jgi:hypothetical protein